MPRNKGSKNKPKVVNDFASQIAEKQSTIESLNTEIASITANIDSLKAELKTKHAALKSAEKEVGKLEAKKTSVYKGYKQDKIEMRGDRAEMSDFPLYLNTVAGGLDCRDQTIGGFSFVVKIYAVPVVEIIG